MISVQRELGANQALITRCHSYIGHNHVGHNGVGHSYVDVGANQALITRRVWIDVCIDMCTGMYGDVGANRAITM